MRDSKSRGRQPQRTKYRGLSWLLALCIGCTTTRGAATDGALADARFGPDGPHAADEGADGAGPVGDARPPPTDDAPALTEPVCGQQACWPMPNTPGANLPNPARYDDSRSDVVTDLVTGLMWQKVPPIQEMLMGPATAHCQALRLGGGPADWRLPAAVELVSLIDFALKDPALPAVFPPDPGVFQAASGADPQGQPRYYQVVAASGIVFANAADSLGRVRCVRTQVAPAVLEPHYLAMGAAPSNTVKDRWTGLEWQVTVEGPSYGFKDAGRYCGALQSAGGGWRLPSIKELYTLVDNRFEQRIDPRFFPDPLPRSGETQYFWSVTPAAGSTTKGWYLRFLDGRPGIDFVSATGDPIDVKMRARCVR